VYGDRMNRIVLISLMNLSLHIMDFIFFAWAPLGVCMLLGSALIECDV
jgi:hypothetical protein